MKGKVYLVGAGPGDPELLTRKAFRVLERADVVLHDELVSPEILALVPARAQVWNVGKRCGQKKRTQKEINALLVAYSNAGRTVVRLKGGDPLIFGRAGEEIEALRRAGIDFEIIPGITAAMAAAAAARVPLTDRRWASKLVLLTGHSAAGKPAGDWGAAAAGEATLALYMPGSPGTDLAHRLREAGWDAATPCVLVSCASTPHERIHRTTVGGLAEAQRLPAPAILLIGRVAEERYGEEGPEATGESPCMASKKELSEV
jgi:uroporphyrin-III C-methyltransferase